MTNEELRGMGPDKIIDYGMSKRRHRLEIIADGLISRVFGEIMGGGFEIQIDDARNDPATYESAENEEFRLAIADQLLYDIKVGKISAHDSIDICKVISRVLNPVKTSGMTPREYENALLNGEVPDGDKPATSDRSASVTATPPPPGVTITAQSSGVQSDKLAEFQKQIDMMADNTKGMQSSIWQQTYAGGTI